jgi:hypothetical protein
MPTAINQEYKDKLKQMIDKPIITDKFRAFDKMVSELGPFMNVFEVDKCVDFMYTIEHSKYDINPSISDCKTQLQIILGSDRYEQVVSEWKKYNNKFVTQFGTLKFKSKLDPTDKTLYDGLDPEDNPDEWEKVYV